MAGLSRVYLTVHTPRYCTYDAAFSGKLAHPDFKAVRDGLVEQGRDAAAAAPDVILVNSCHLVTTFPTVIDGTPRHRGVLTAQEAPELIHGVAYDYPLDYGTVMPLVCYLDRPQQIPMVPVSACLSADLNEAFAWGRLIAQTTRDLGRRAAFAASGSVSHKLVRGPEAWPTAADQELDHRFAALLADGEYDRLWAWLPDYAQAAQPEMGGRHLAMMLGALIEAGTRYAATVHAYGPSSGSGNYVISLAG
jgi:3,4-dihydroxyphenylacetate 2,3-dioxygenase